jgi:hypothetical protein
MNGTELISKVNKALTEEFEVDVSAFVPNANIKDPFEIDSLGLLRSGCSRRKFVRRQNTGSGNNKYPYVRKSV